jgi:hypothetical protein
LFVIFRLLKIAPAYRQAGICGVPLTLVIEAYIRVRLNDEGFHLPARSRFGGGRSVMQLGVFDQPEKMKFSPNTLA